MKHLARVALYCRQTMPYGSKLTVRKVWASLFDSQKRLSIAVYEKTVKKEGVVRRSRRQVPQTYLL
jgi:hypothetical protein